jgi:predicted ArsR family transcriptional regulator
MPTNTLTAYQRLEIQMEAIVPLVRDLQEILGADVVSQALEERLRRQQEAANAAPKREPDFERVERGMARFAEGGALEYRVLDKRADGVDMDVTSCAYARLMERLGARDLGPSLVCGPDFANATRIGAKLKRSQTCMQGASHCDFRYERAT